MARLAITIGEPAGIGPDIALSAIQDLWPSQITLIGCFSTLVERANTLGLSPKLRRVDVSSAASALSTLTEETPVIDVPCAERVQAGTLNPNNSASVVETLRIAAQGCLNRQFDAIVTAPVHKGVINDAGIPFSGHTEYFAERAGVQKVVMMLATPSLRVALATTHLPLKAVSAAITGSSLTQVIRILHTDLQQKFGISTPRILVCGLNPHAGENGHLGREELDTIIPALDQCRAQGIRLIGPLPADTLFTPRVLQTGDAVLSMFHDQGLPVLKSQGFGEAVNITLGLPFIRTSVDHGTALDLAGQGAASDTSLRAAITMASELAAHRN